MGIRKGSTSNKIFRWHKVVPSVVFLILILPAGLRAAAQSSTSDRKSFDGPAELPREFTKSSLKDTPANGKTWVVRAGESFERVLAGVSCGDVIRLQAGATFSGSFELPNKNCDDSHWIIIRTSAPDSSLPPEGTRLTPCYAGVPSLPGRPRLNCASTANVLAKIEFNGKSGSGPLSFSSGAGHYRLLGLELTRSSAPGPVYNLVQFGGSADHVVFDRLWLHGTPQDETVRGILLGASRSVAVVDSFFTDFHCVAKTGSCTDAQAVAGGLGDGPMGPYKIVDNFLEAAGQSIMFGGGRASMTPQDIEIRHNHMFKPLTWMKGQAGYVGGTDGNPFIVKNLFELKNAQRVLLEGNVLEDTWGGFSQVGFAILLTPKNQAGKGNNLCPICQVTDVTVRYDSIRHVAAGVQIANGLADNGAAALAGERYSIHDVIIDDIDGAKYNGPGEFAQLSVAAGAAILQNVTINHVTVFPANRLFIVGDQLGKAPQMKNFVFTNSIVSAGVYPVWSTGGGGTANCAARNSPLSTFDACFSSYTFVANAIIAVPSSARAEKWPPKNFFPASEAVVRFSSYNGGNGGDYHLQPSSPYKGAGTDGKDLGADVDAVDSAIAGIE
jgi:hypothetical protein